MLGEERNSVFNAPHLVFFPGIAIMLTVLGFNRSATACAMRSIHVCAALLRDNQ